MKEFRMYFLLLFFTFVTILPGCMTAETTISNPVTIEDAPTAAPPPPPPKTTITIRATGDILIHSPIIDYAGRLNKDYDFSPIFKDIAPLLSAADYTIVEQEVPMGNPKRGYAGYPLFNSPKTLATALKEVGVDMATTSNNHSLDQGEEGIDFTLKNLDDAGIEHTGSFRSQEEADHPLIKEIQGIKIAFLSYTYGTNGIPVPNGKGYLVNFLDPEKIRKDIQSVRDQVDLVSVSVHWGEENQRHPNDEQKKLARDMIDWGADLIIGDHPHVIQPIEWIDTGSRQGAVVYSMGNFISNQRWRYSDTGIIFQATITKDGNNTRLDQVGYIPVWVDRDPDYSFRVLPIEKALDDYKNKRDPRISDSDAQLMQQALEDVHDLAGKSFEISPHQDQAAISNNVQPK